MSLALKQVKTFRRGLEEWQLFKVTTAKHEFLRYPLSFIGSGAGLK